jgi:ABC-2 type transport system permease protein
MLALAAKDLKLLYRDKASLFFAFLFPILYALFFGSLFQGVGRDIGGRMDVLLVDEDQSPASQSLVARLCDPNQTRELRAEVVDRKTAMDLVRRGKRVAFVVIPRGFGLAEANRFAGQIPRLEVGADPSRGAEAGMLRAVLFQIMGRRLQDSFANPAEMRAQIGQAREALQNDPNADAMTTALLPFFGALDMFLGQLERQSAASAATQTGGAAEKRDASFRGFQPAEIVAVDTRLEHHGPRNAWVISFPQAIVWGIMGCAAGFGISLVVERQHGTLTRLRLAPVSFGSILAGKALACFLAITTVSTGLLVFLSFMPKVVIYAPPLLAMAVLCVSICFTGLMMLLATLGRTEQSASGIGWALLTIMAMIGGGMVPVFFMPGWMQQFSSISPVKWAIVAFEGPLWREYSFSEMLLPCGVLVAIGGVSFAIGVGVFSRTATR